MGAMLYTTGLSLNWSLRGPAVDDVWPFLRILRAELELLYEYVGRCIVVNPR